MDELKLTRNDIECLKTIILYRNTELKHKIGNNYYVNCLRRDFEKELKRNQKLFNKLENLKKEL